MRALLVCLLLFLTPPAFAQQSSADEAAIRDVIAAWYAELRKPAGRTHWRYYAPGAIDGGPAETELFPESRALGPTISNELAARALQFSYDVDLIKVDPHFAKVVIWERGYFYAWANQETYENAASALFVMEKQPNGGWLILAHEAVSIGIPPNKITDPLPALAEHWKSGQGGAELVQPQP